MNDNNTFKFTTPPPKCSCGKSFNNLKINFSICQHIKKCAFTLAEVIVIVAILGIVATITIPAVINNFQQSYFITKYRKTFTVLDNAFQQYQIDTDLITMNPQVRDSRTGRNTNWRGTGASGGCMKVLGDEFFVPYLGARTTTKAWDQNYNLFRDYNNNKGIKQLNGVKPNARQNISGKFILKDGTEILYGGGHIHWVISNDPNENRLGTLNRYPGVFNGVLFIDVNGEAKGPNTIGRDIYLAYHLTTGLYPNPLPEKYFMPNYADCYPYFASVHHTNEACTKRSTGVSCSRWFLGNKEFQK